MPVPFTLLMITIMMPLQVLNLSAHKRAVVDVQWNLHDLNVIASGASDGSIALIDIRHPHNVIQSMTSSEGMACLRCNTSHFPFYFCFASETLLGGTPVRRPAICLPAPTAPWCECGTRVPAKRCRPSPTRC